MPSSAAWVARASGVILAILVMRGHAAAQGRTDVVTLPNGDRITGEVVRLDRGRLEFKTDDAGTLYLEWDKVATVQATRAVEVVTEDGRRILGSLGPSTSRTLTVVGEAERVSVPMAEVTIIRQIGSSFWSKLDGSIDAGYSYTRSSGVAQLNVNWDTYYRTPAARARLAVSLNQTRKDDDSETDDRGSLEASYLRYPWPRWFISAASRFETNKSLGLELRSQVGGAFGPRLINSNRGQLGLGAGLVFNDEQGVDVDRTQNVEALVMLQGSYYTYDRPRTNLDLSVVYYPSLSDPGRRRLQLDTGAKRELWKDFFLALTLFTTYDSRPPNPSADTSDVGVVASIGWTY
jgi:Protein of unknown function, DUF481